MTPEEAYRAGWSGDFRGRDAIESRAWRAALSAQRWLAQPDHAPPDLATIAGFLNSDRIPAVWAALEGMRAALLSFDPRASEWAELLVRLDGAGAIESMGASLACAWMELCAGRGEQADLQARRAGTFATEVSCAPIVIEATVIRALAAELRGDGVEALASARRASRMAAAESFPQSQYLANVVLARLRRLNGAGHLATRILAALARAAPAPWHAWIAWEAVMAGDLPQSLIAPASLLANTLSAATSGEPTAFDSAARALLDRLPRWSPWAIDVEALFQAIDTDRPADETIAMWRAGNESAVPARIRGACADPSRHESPLAYVLARPDQDAARIAARSAPLWSTRYTIALDPAQGRTEVLLSALALAGPSGIDRDRLFRSVYGFEYRPAVHRSVFKALIHRARVWLEERGAIDHDEGHFVLRVVRPMLIADPRCEHPLEERMLRFLAAVGGAGSAKDVAAGLGVPLRSVQGVLKNLVEDGAVQLDRRGRAIEYRVEDTTFSEPTRF